MYVFVFASEVFFGQCLKQVVSCHLSGDCDNVQAESEEEDKEIVRVIGLTLETRPDSICLDELHRMREYGCTRIQLGVQHTDDRMLKRVNRGCYNADAIRATLLCKNVGLKIDYHLMPDLPNTTMIKDMIMFDYVTNSSQLQCDQLKVPDQSDETRTINCCDLAVYVLHVYVDYDRYIHAKQCRLR